MNARGRIIQGLCPCGNKQAMVGRNSFGQKIYRAICGTCRNKGRRVKADHCQNCGFVAVNSVQLDVDHIDGNGSNNDPNNLWTLCANCHRLKTHANQDCKHKEW